MHSRRKNSLLVLVLATLATLALAAPVLAQSGKVKVASTLREIYDNLPLYVAAEGGLFKKHGLEVEVTHFAGGGEVVRAVSGGASDLGMVGTSAAIIAASRGEPLKIFSAWSAPAFGIVFVVPVDSPLKAPADLNGKKIGISRPGSVSHTGAVAMLKAAGVKADILPVGAAGDGWAMLKAGRIDVSWHSAPDVYSLIDRKEGRLIGAIYEYLKEYQQGALVALEATLGKSKDPLARFLAATDEAIKIIVSKPAEAAALGSKGMGLQPVLLEKMTSEVPKTFFQLGMPTQANYAGSLAEAVATGGLKKQPDYDSVVDRRFFAAAK